VTLVMINDAVGQLLHALALPHPGRRPASSKLARAFTVTSTTRDDL
jgi:hypothetical protein